jgi:hypothetical protein
MSVGAFVIGLVASSHLLGVITSVVQSWLARAGERSVKLELDDDILEVRGISSASSTSWCVAGSTATRTHERATRPDHRGLGVPRP